MRSVEGRNPCSVRLCARLCRWPPRFCGSRLDAPRMALWACSAERAAGEKEPAFKPSSMFSDVACSLLLEMVCVCSCSSVWCSVLMAVFGAYKIGQLRCVEGVGVRLSASQTSRAHAAC